MAEAELLFERFGLGIAKGMGVTLKNLLRPPVTTQYPVERLRLSRRVRSPQIIWLPENCTGCATCAKACPQGNIEIATHQRRNIYLVDKFTIDFGRCMFCGLCVEACPFNALFMGRKYEQARYVRAELVQEKEELALSADKERSGYYHPDLEALLPPQSLLIRREKGIRRWS